jgi:hypothetical protein
MAHTETTLREACQQFVDHGKREGTIPQGLTITEVEWRPTSYGKEARVTFDDGTTAMVQFDETVFQQPN